MNAALDQKLFSLRPGDNRFMDNMRQLSIAKAILVLTETRMRSADFSFYERLLERKSQTLMEIAERKRKEEEMRLAAIEARKAAGSKLPTIASSYLPECR
ncbi:hypothetical protein [Rhodoferax sp.]|uniref:hypothetical protein n=1 Tax=Rhodoferax sp. TaxID=50421 RepID=UPI00273161B2|nr:hypothetical protein [Rhodoferax sp.]MDP1527889.1 hypothetical protein [Rhodoferax sp.]MDP1944498.1 hypothetical protein [Rhodoferax sp.]MDP2440146.1 hypothetical protein [Rhodoferax sp.]MDZ4208856.1 hypothetical protein [Rhodoferax sp.]